MTRPLRLLPLTLLAACLAGPTGEEAPADPEPVDVPGASSDAVAEDVPVHDPAPAPGEPDSLRRLSTRELGHALEDLYGLDVDLSVVPPEGDTLGFDNDRRSQFSTTALVDGTIELTARTAERIVDEQPDRIPCDLQAVDDEALEACLEALVRTEGRRLFRHPLSDAEVDAFVGLIHALPEDADPTDRTLLVLQAMLLSPDFHIIEEFPLDPEAPADQPTRVDGFTLATRMAAFLWESVPDDALLQAAEAGDLDTPEGVAAQVARMTEDPRFVRSQARFLYSWLNLDKLEGRTKLAEDDLDEALRQASREEVDRFVEDVLLADDAPFLDVFRSTEAVVNPRLAGLYGVAGPDDGWMRVSVPDRPGLITRFGFLAAHGHPDRPSPVLRGVTLNERLMCVHFPPPPANAESAAAAVADDVSLAELTNREAYELTTMQGSCASCHTTINPVGYALENYDTMARFRTVEPNGREVDATAEIAAIGTTVSTPVELMAGLAASPQVHDCAARHWLRYASGGGQLENDAGLRGALAQEIAAGLPFGDVAVRIVTDPRFAQMIPQDG
jgi:hypothetical protein